jgi:hypothetical protein
MSVSDTMSKADQEQPAKTTPRIFRVFWRQKDTRKSHFMLFECNHQSIDELAEALKAGLVVGNELYTDRSSGKPQIIVGRVRTAIRDEDVLRLQAVWGPLEELPSAARHR